MTITRDRIVALIFIALSLAYINLSGDIELYPGEEEDVFNPRTFPFFVGYLALITSVLLFFFSGKKSAAKPETIESWQQFAWWQVGALCLTMLAYGLTIKSVGFFVSTNLFLIAGFLILGERRWYVLILAALPLTAFMQFTLHGLLNIYITDPVLKALGIIT